MDDLEMKMGIKIEAVRDMMLHRFSGVDRKLTAIEQLLKQLINPQSKTGNSPEKRCILTEQNTDKGTECYKNQDEGKTMAVEGGDGGRSHECGPNKVGGDDGPSRESGPKVAIEGGDDEPSHESGPKKPFRVKVSSDDDDDQETDDQMQGPPGVLNVSDRSRYGPPREAGRSCGWAELHAKHYGTCSPHRPNYSFGKGFCGPAWVGLQETEFSKKNGPPFGSKVVNADVTESGLKFGCQKGVLVVQDDISKDFLKSNHLVVKTGQDKTDAGVEEEQTCSLTPRGKKKLIQWAKKDFGPVGSVESVKGLDWSTLVKASTDSRGAPWGYTGDNKPQEQVVTNGSIEGGPKAPRHSPTVKKAEVTGCVGKKSENDFEKGAKRTSQDYSFIDFSKFNRLGTYNSWMGSSDKKVVKTGQDDILKNSWTGSWNGWSSTGEDKTDVLLQDSSKPDPWANSGPLGKAVQIETVCEPGSVECNKGLDWSKLVEVKTDLKRGWGLKRKHPDSPNDSPIAIGSYPTFNPHLGVVTTGEQEILREIKPIMQRIMHQKGYDVGDPLPGDDQTHMLESVFNHHPEKAQKMDARVDYIMVDEHTKLGSSKVQHTGSPGGWDAAKTTTPATGGSWGAPKFDQSQQTGSSGAWGPNVLKADEPKPVWVSKKSQNKTATGSGSSAWGQKVVTDNDGPGWGRKKNEFENDKGSSAWGQKVVTDNDGPMKSQNEPEEDGEQKPGSWGWNRKAEQKPDQGGGWKKKENWGPKRDRPARPVGGPTDAPRPNVPLTVTRQRIDLFTSDEQEILSVIEPMMQSIKRIMNPVGYNDGDPLSADDQTYILDNIFAHHPDKDQKAGAGVDYIMITKHTQFQDSRCFFVVSTDGKKEDFSYRKCLENFVRSKFPDKVDEFIPKYFRKNQPRPPMNRDEAGTPQTPRTPGSRPGWGRDFNTTGDDSATPASGWKKDGSTTPEDGGTPAATSGWKKEANTTGPEEGGAAASGWKKEASPAPEAGGASASGWDQAGDSGSAKKSGWGS